MFTKKKVQKENEVAKLSLEVKSTPIGDRFTNRKNNDPTNEHEFS